MLVMLQLAVLAGCTEQTPSPPKIEGRVTSVSQSDIREAIALIEAYMRHEFGRVVPINRVQVRDHNQIIMIYRYGSHEYWAPVDRVHGVWKPPLENVYVTG